MENFFKNSIITFITEAGIFILGFFSLIIITRMLGPAGKGIYSLILLIPSLMLTFGSCGIGAANIYFTGNKKYKVEDVISNSLILVIFLSVILVFSFYMLYQFDFFKNLIHSDEIPTIYLWLMVLSMPISLLLGFFQNIVRGKEQIIRFNIARLLENALNFIAIFVLLFLFRGGVSSAVFAYLISITGASIFTIFLVRKIAKIRFKINFKLLKDSLAYGWKTYLANMFSFLSYRIDMFLLVLLLNPSSSAAQIGFYSIAVSIAEKMFLIPGAFSTVLFPRVSSIEESEANSVTPKIIRHTLFIIIIASVFLALLINPLIAIVFGKEFLPSVFPFLALIPGIIAFSIGGVIAADLSGRGKPQFAIYSSVACVLTNIALNIIFIPKWGITGAALASSVAYWVDTLVVFIAFLNISKKRIKDMLIIKKEDFKDYLYILSFLNFKKNNL